MKPIEIGNRGCCFYCGNQDVMTKDHFVPKSKGGSPLIVYVCKKCNEMKGDMEGNEFIGKIERMKPFEEKDKMIKNVKIAINLLEEIYKFQRIISPYRCDNDLF